MATALEQFKARSSALARVNEHRQSVRKIVDYGEMAAAASLAGALDTRAPEVMGAKPSLLLGVALLAGGAAMSQRDMMAGGVGMLLPHFYGLGQGLAT